MAIPSKLTLTPGNDQIVELDGLIDQSNNSFVNNATVTATLVDVFHANVANATGIAFTYVPSSNGVYRGQIPAAFTAKYGVGYVLKIDATNTTSTLHLEIPVEVVPRNS